MGILMSPKELDGCVCRYKRFSKELVTCLLERERPRLLVSSVMVYIMAIFNMQLQMEGFSVLLSLTMLKFLISLRQFCSCQETLSHSGI